MIQKYSRPVLIQLTQWYLSKDLLFLAECMLISAHIIAICQTVQTYPPLNPQ